MIVGAVRNLVTVAPRRGNEAQLIRRVHVEDQGRKPAAADLAIVNDVGDRRAQPQVAPIAIPADEVRKALRVAANAHLIVGLVEVAGAHHQFRVVVAFEPASRNDIEDAVGAVTVLGVVAAAMHLQEIDVLRIELRPDVAGDVRVRDRHTIDEPTHLVTAANVQLVVRHVRSGHERGDRLQSIGAVRAGRVLNILPTHERRRRH